LGNKKKDGMHKDNLLLVKKDIETAVFKWYVVHTYSGFEHIAKDALKDRIRTKKRQSEFGEILIPMETIEDYDKGHINVKSKKYFPSYIFVQMILNKDTEYLVRNTYKITGFVGGSKNPPSLSEVEIKRMRQMTEIKKKIDITLEYDIGDLIKVIEGPFSNFNGRITEINKDKKKIKIMVSIFGRLTPIELNYCQVEKIY